MTINISLLSTSNSSITYDILLTSDNSIGFPDSIARNQKFLGKWILFPYQEYTDELKYQNNSDTFLTMIASEKVLSKDWDAPEEDAAWANL